MKKVPRSEDGPRDIGSDAELLHHRGALDDPPPPASGFKSPRRESSTGRAGWFRRSKVALCRCERQPGTDTEEGEGERDKGA